MKLVIVRHGQTNANAQKLIQGRIDNPLNALGKKQAKKAGQVLKKSGIEFDVVASTPLSRALESAQLVARKLNYKNEIYIEPQLVERDFRPFEMEKIVDVFPIIINTGYTHPEYEDDVALEKRIKAGIYKLYKKFEDKTVLLSAHAHVIRAVFRLVDPVEYDYSTHFLGNSSIHIFNINKNEISFVESLNNEPI